MKKKQFVTAALSLLLALVLVAGAGCVTRLDGAAAQAPDTIAIVFTNDIHCGVTQVINDEGSVTNMGYAGLSALVEQTEALYGAENVTVIDIGDAMQGDAIGTLSKGGYLVDIMNQIGYDLFVPGNHEFDYGMARMLELMEGLDATVVSSNFTDLASGESVFFPYTILTYGGTQVAFVGITTPESFTKSTPAYFQNEDGEFIYGFREGNNGQNLYDAVQAAVDAARAEGADYVVAAGHLGIDEQSAPWRSTDVIANTDGIDVFLDGHSHSVIPGDEVPNMAGEAVIHAQTGTKLANIGVVTISGGEITSELISGYDQVDPETDAFIAGIMEEFQADLDAVVGQTDVDLTVNDPATGNRMVRNAETNLGDLAADAYRYVLGNGVDGLADVAFVNGGGVRADIAAGEMTFGEVIAVHPFNNVGCVVEATGQEILDALEMASNAAPNENGGFLQVSGVSYTIDTTMPSSVVMDDMRSFVSVDGDYRVKDVLIGGEPIDLEKTYTVASHNYMLLDGGDGINMFRDNNIVVQPVILDNQILITYIAEFLDGVVGEEYADPYGQGRISIID
ncbi:MAG: bifunctional metallophosphatase/5'-nucleotidase [Clostridiales bacterium]|jgi:2',3'-cyclic-nucleotide 2'-phosphodiesterase (5'-nucleotidase family)|nr:bifunctional metallophosphatase/5'-nucleotidase [Clostridiales bacterium]